MYKLKVSFINNIDVVKIKFSYLNDLLYFLNYNKKRIERFELFYFDKFLLSWKSFYLVDKEVYASDLIEIKKGSYRDV